VGDGGWAREREEEENRECKKRSVIATYWGWVLPAPGSTTKKGNENSQQVESGRVEAPSNGRAVDLERGVKKASPTGRKKIV